MIAACIFFIFSCYVDHRDLHSFPTRRSSDLSRRVRRFHGPHALLQPVNQREVISSAAKERLAKMNVRLNEAREDRKSTRLNSSHSQISYAVFCLKKKKKKQTNYVIISVLLYY